MSSQTKINSKGERVVWEINQNLISQTISWANKDPATLNREVSEMNNNFPFFYLVLSPENPSSQKDLLCPQCGNIIVFADDLICIGCKTLFSPHTNPRLAYIGQIPSLVGSSKRAALGDKGAIISGRPFLKRVHRQIMNGQPSFKKYFATRKTKEDWEIYFIPVVIALYPNNWPKSEPAVCLEKDYFKLLFKDFDYNLTDFHAYSQSGDLLKLCNYRSWRTVTLCTVLQQRIVPKIIIDLMIADLIEVGRINEVIRSLGTSLHSLYNYIGKGSNSQRFKALYEQHVSFQ